MWCSVRWNLQEIFGRPCPVVMDIGFGGGESILGMAAGHPGQNFVGVEVGKDLCCWNAVHVRWRLALIKDQLSRVLF
ncbi:unnamed protein product [Choristocarpus tenellus]